MQSKNNIYNFFLWNETVLNYVPSNSKYKKNILNDLKSNQHNKNSPYALKRLFETYLEKRNILLVKK